MVVTIVTRGGSIETFDVEMDDEVNTLLEAYCQLEHIDFDEGFERAVLWALAKKEQEAAKK